MQADKIVYVCNFSSVEHRKHLHLKNWTLRNRMCQLLKIPAIGYKDYGPWNVEFFKSFEKDLAHKYYVMYPHTGVIGDYQHYELNGISYYALNSDVPFHSKLLRRAGILNEVQQLTNIRKTYSSLIRKVKPNLLVICGHEVPECISAIQNDIPVYIMLQTVLNRDNSHVFSIGTDYTRALEVEILKKIKYVGCPLDDYFKAAVKINPNAYYYKISFPTTPPPVFPNINTEFDFVFFAGSVMKNKGVEDAIKALAIVCKTHPNTKLNIIGKCQPNYRQYLDELVTANSIINNVIFHEYFPLFEDVYKQVQKSKYSLLPSITAPFNTTVRESMFMGKPTIVYRTSVTEKINENAQCLLEAQMEDVDDLAIKMVFALDHPDIMRTVGEKGKKYAEHNLSSEAIGSRLIDTFSSTIVLEYNQIEVDQNLLYNKL